jgi:hypothetical protein
VVAVDKTCIQLVQVSPETYIDGSLAQDAHQAR